MYTYWTNTANFIWRENSAGQVSFWKASTRQWTEWFNRAHCEAQDVEAGWGQWTEYTGPMPEGSVEITSAEELRQRVVDAFVNGSPEVSQNIVDTLGALAPRSYKDRTNDALNELINDTALDYDTRTKMIDAGADLMRRYAGEKRDLSLGHPVSELIEWNRLTSWQRETWRRIFRKALEKRRAEIENARNA